MSAVLDFALSYWGIISVVVIFILKLIFDYDGTLKRVRDLIFLAEEHARKEALKTGQEKFEWVKEEGYQYLPKSLRLFISKDMFGMLVQNVFDKLTGWAEEHSLR